MPITIISPRSSAICSQDFSRFTPSLETSTEEFKENADESTDPSSPSSYQLYTRRWLILFIFAGLAFLNNTVCYSLASVQPLAKQYYSFPSTTLSPHSVLHPTHSASTRGLSEHLNGLVSEFFLTYVVFSFPSSYFVDRFGLRAGVLLGGWLQVIGCGLRTLAKTPDTFYFLHVGQFVASLGQAFLVNPPPLLAESWFGPDERTFATTVAVNSNSLGIAGAYLLGPYLVRSPSDIPFYLQLIFLCSAGFALLASIFFTSVPPTPPSLSQAFHSRNVRLTISWRSIVSLFRHRGFLHTLLAFSLAEATINAFSAFMNSILVPSGFSNSFIGVLAVSLIIFCMIGSAIFGFIVDRSHHYKSMLVLSLIGTGMAIAFFIWAPPSMAMVSLSVCVLGSFLGPVQPLALESAVECTYPSSASTVTALLQVVGNLASAALFPVFILLRDPDTGLMTPALWALAVAQFAVAAFYLTFNGKYLRRLHEAGDPEYFLHIQSLEERTTLLFKDNKPVAVKKVIIAEDSDVLIAPVPNGSSKDGESSSVQLSNGHHSHSHSRPHSHHGSDHSHSHGSDHGHHSHGPSVQPSNGYGTLNH